MTTIIQNSDCNDKSNYAIWKHEPYIMHFRNSLATEPAEILITERTVNVIAWPILSFLNRRMTWRALFQIHLLPHICWDGFFTHIQSYFWSGLLASFVRMPWTLALITKLLSTFFISTDKMVVLTARNVLKYVGIWTIREWTGAYIWLTC